MAARLSQLERLNGQQATKLAKQSQELDALRAENEHLRASLRADRASAPEGSEAGASRSAAKGKLLEALRAERDRFQKQVEEMTKFLEDYGLTWVGDASREPSESDPTESCREPEAGAGSAIPSSPGSPTDRGSRAVVPLDLQAISSRVHDLNASVEGATARVEHLRVGGSVQARIVADMPTPVPVSFFGDGVKLGKEPFRAYDHQASQQLIHDIMDGFFPYALKDDHPDGVTLKVIDRTSVDFLTWLRDRAESDPDLVDQGDRLAPAAGRAVRAGRGLRGSSSTPAPYRAPDDEVSLLATGRDPASPSARLQIKLPGGVRVVFCMEATATVGDLEDALESWCATRERPPPLRGSDGSAPQVLRTAFPPTGYTDRAQSLRQAGLTPTATLFVGAELTGAQD